MQMQFDMDYLKNVLLEIMAIDSPSGFTANVTKKLKSYADDLGYSNYITNKGNLVIEVDGQSDKTVGVCAHVDTLGLVVRGFKEDGTLSFTRVGGAILPTLDGEYCKIYTRGGKVYTGTILSNSPSSHVFPDAGTLARTEENMHVKIDEIVKSAADTKALGIMSGDFICFESKTQITDSGFIKSRFLDDKLSAVIILAVLKYIRENNIEILHNLKVIFSSYEEVGHGMSHMPEGISELLAVDMGCIGKDLNCTEYDVSICAKDSGGPYDFDFTTRLWKLAKQAELNFAMDIYPMYGSDVGATWRAGHDVIGALIGPGVAASHGMERTHMKATENTMKLLYLYLTAEPKEN